METARLSMGNFSFQLDKCVSMFLIWVLTAVIGLKALDPISFMNRK